MSSTSEEKNYYYKKMTSIRSGSDIHRITKQSVDYFSKWYLPAIREAIVFGDQRYSSKQIADILSPKISLSEVEKSLTLLKELKLIDQDDEGHWIRCETIIAPESGIESLILGNYHREMLRLAIESIDRYASSDRDLSALTLSISKDKFHEIKDLIDQFKQELLNLVCTQSSVDQVVQINVQLFPLTLPIKPEEEK